MDNESSDAWDEVEWLPNDLPIPLGSARIIRPSLTNVAGHSSSVIALSTMGPRPAAGTPLGAPVRSCGSELGRLLRDSLQASFTANKSPATLIRTLDGRIRAWSHRMESRYGFPASRAIGLTSHELLRTISCHAFDESTASSFFGKRGPVGWFVTGPAVVPS
jgi:hypothetical protein